MRIFRQKRGDQETWHLAIELLLAGLVVIGIIAYVRNATEDTTFEKMYVARDLALLLDSVYAAPGDVTYVYYLADKKFHFDIKNAEVVVSELDRKRPIKYFYAEDNMMKNPGWSSETPVRAIEITKKENEVSVQGISLNVEKNAEGVFSEFVKFVNDAQENAHSEPCAKRFYFDNERFGKGFYIMIYKDGNIALFRSNGAEKQLSTAKIKPLASTASRGMFYIDSVLSDYAAFVADAVIAPYGGLPEGINAKRIMDTGIFLVAKNNKWVLAVPSPELNAVERCK